MLVNMADEFVQAFIETGWMLGIATFFSIAVGVPLGIFLFVTSEGMFWQNRIVQSIAGTTINIIRSLPYIILLVLLIPLAKALLGTSTGPTRDSLKARFEKWTAVSLKQPNHAGLPHGVSFGMFYYPKRNLA